MAKPPILAWSGALKASCRLEDQPPELDMPDELGPDLSNNKAAESAVRPIQNGDDRKPFFNTNTLSELSDICDSGCTSMSVLGMTDVETMKATVREKLSRKHKAYQVAHFYHTTGIAQKIARSPAFENVTLAVIAWNAVWIAVDTDWNKAPTFLRSDVLFQAMEHFFCSYFTLELAIRFMAFQGKMNVLKDAWFMFDSLLVVLMVLETWVFTAIAQFVGGGGSPLGGQANILRLFRLLWLSRLLRMLRSLPELMILIKAMVTAMRSVFYVMCLLVILVYVFAIAVTQMSEDSEVQHKYFDNVLLSMYTLLIYGTLLDELSTICSDIMGSGRMDLMAIFLIYIGLSALTVMNMLIGVLCEVVSAVAKIEKELIMTTILAEKLESIIEELDTDGDGMVSYKEFSQLMQRPTALRALQDVGVDPVGLVDFAELLFVKDGVEIDLTFDQFMATLLDLRGSNTATVKDIMNFTTKNNMKLSTLNKDVNDLIGKTRSMEDAWTRMEDQMNALIQHCGVRESRPHRWVTHYDVNTADV
jgi:hypothetical protein